MNEQRRPDKSRNRLISSRLTVGLASLALLAACSGRATTQEPVPTQTIQADSDGFTPRCEPQQVAAQNVWQPFGAALRSAPNIAAPIIANGSFMPNQAVAFDGWLHTGVPTYPDNTPPYNNDIWLHTVNSTQPGWVNFAAVREYSTVPDTTIYRQGYAGVPVGLPLNCQATYDPTTQTAH